MSMDTDQRSAPRPTPNSMHRPARTTRAARLRLGRVLPRLGSLFIALGLVFTALPAAPASAYTGSAAAAESQFFNLLNGTRASAGLGPVAATRETRAATTRALDSTPASVPYNAVPADAPLAPASPAPSPSSSDSGPTRAPTFVLTFAVLLATIALGHELSRRFALADQVPQSQFLTVLIERPG